MLRIGMLWPFIKKIMWLATCLAPYCLFPRRGGVIECVVEGVRHYSSDLPQGGMEIPCRFIFRAEEKELQKPRNILTQQDFSQR